MRILISGICGFVGSRLALALHAADDIQGDSGAQSHAAGAIKILGIDNLSRRGSWENLKPLREAGVQVVHGDVRSPSDVEACGAVDWIIDAAANPSVLAGTDQTTTSHQLVETNVLGTVHLLEACKRHQAGFTLLSSSRVYSIPVLSGLPLRDADTAFALDPRETLPEGVSARGISESCSTSAPTSLYGATKLAAEVLALEYHYAFDFPVWINRCGLMAGASQFGRPDQGIFAYWLHSWRERQPLRYFGFGGQGYQVRDCLHPRDLAELIALQVRAVESSDAMRIVNVSGGLASARSLRQLSQWCEQRWGPQPISKDIQQRRYDLPWLVLDHTRATETWGWTPRTSTPQILEEIADFADQNPDWLSRV